MTHAARSWLTRNWPALLALSALALFADNAIYNVPLLIMALLALARSAGRFRQVFANRSYRLLIAVFMALWLPQLISLFDAHSWLQSVRVAAAYPGYGLAALFMAIHLRAPEQINTLINGMVLIVTVWCADALLALTGAWSFIGYNPDPGLVTGILFPKLSIGHLLAVLSPVIFEWARRRQDQHPLSWLVVIAVIVIILLSGRRVAWMMLLLAIVGYAIYATIKLRVITPRAVTLACLLGLMSLGVTYWQYEPFAGRVDKTLGLLSEQTETVDQATSYRLDIWKNGLRMASDHWLNGIGPRGYRYAYAGFADKNDYWLNEEHFSPLHPHLLLLEIAVETGLIGLAGYLLAWLVLLKVLRDAGSPVIGVAGMSVLIALFPLNAHMAFYGSYWTAFCWWLLGLVFAAHGCASTPKTAGAVTA